MVNFQVVFDYSWAFSVLGELGRGFRVQGEVRAPNVFFSSKMTVQLSFLKALRPKSHSYQQLLEFRGIPGTTKALPYQDFVDIP